MADFSKFPLSLVVSKVNGYVSDGVGHTEYHVDHDGILHVKHMDDGDTAVMTFRLVPVEQIWREIDG